jgi:hypothetical protein
LHLKSGNSMVEFPSYENDKSFTSIICRS